MNSKPFAPTEEELVSLGFGLSTYDGIHYEKYFKDAVLGIHFVPSTNSFFLVHWEDIFSDTIYPKSLEELKCLISMMNP